MNNTTTTEPKRVLLLLKNSSYRAEAFLAAAGRLGVEVIQGVDIPPQLAGHWQTHLALQFDEPEATVQKIVDFARQKPVQAILSVDDSATVIAAQASERLGLAHNSGQAALAARNKYRMRQLLAAAGVPAPKFRLYETTADPAAIARQVDYPCVVKPLTLSGSRGVMRANNPAEFEAAFGRLSRMLRAFNHAASPPDPPSTSSGRGPEGGEKIKVPPSGGLGANFLESVEARAMEKIKVPPSGGLGGPEPATSGAGQILVEDFIPGFEVAVEGILDQGQLHMLALFDKPDPLDGPFFEETIYVTPSRLPPERQQAIADCTARAALALGLRQGPVHAELRLNEVGPWLVEVAGRSIGGLCSKTLRFGPDISLETLILRQAVGLELAWQPDEVARGVMMIPIPESGILKNVHGVEAAENVPGIEGVEITAKINYPLQTLPEGDSYLGFIFASGDTPAQVEHALREAHQKLRFTIEPILPLYGFQ